MIVLELTDEEAAYLYDEVAYALVDPSQFLNRYERGMSRMAVRVRTKLAAQGVQGVLAASPRAHVGADRPQLTRDHAGGTHDGTP